MDRLISIFTILGEIFLACLPVYFLLVFLDWALTRVGNRFMAYDWQTYFERKLDKAKEREQAMWDKRAKALDDKDKSND